MMPVLMKRTVVPGRAYAVTDVDRPDAGVLAVALSGPDGWTVADGSGVVAVRPDRRSAVALMLRTAVAAAGRVPAGLLAG